MDPLSPLLRNPTLVTSSRVSTLSPVRTSTVSFHTRAGLRDPGAAEDQEAACAVTSNGWCIGWSPAISLSSRILTRSPTRNRQSIAAFRARLAVDQPSAHLGRGRDPIYLNDVVFPSRPGATEQSVPFPWLEHSRPPRWRATVRDRSQHSPPLSDSAPTDHAGGEDAQNRFGRGKR